MTPDPSIAGLTAAADVAPPLALQRLGDAFSLSPFEMRAAMLAFAYEGEPDIAAAVARASGEPRACGVPVWLFHAALGERQWRAFSPAASLRRWRILRCEGAAPQAQLRFRLAEPVFDAMTGTFCLDEALEPVLSPVPDGRVAEPAELDALAAGFALADSDGLSPVLVAPWLDGSQRVGAALRAAGLRPYRIETARLAARVESVVDLQRLFTRDSAMRPAALIAETPSDPLQAEALAAFVDGLPAHVVIVGDQTPQGLRRHTHRLERRGVAREAATAFWKQALGRRAARKLNGSVERAAAQFDLDLAAISRTANAVRGDVEAAPTAAEAGRLFWAAAARAVWPEPGALARIIEPRATFDDIVLPDATLEELRALTRHVRHAATVLDDWGFDGNVGARGRGVVALFSGPSGTGKTLAAEVVANALALPLVIADFSQLQSKWVGEGPKLAARLFDTLDRGGAVLLIDEADGLIGKRATVVEAQDKYANAETGYFLQRLEAYRGLAILTTNLKGAIDEAFLRRFRFALDFPLPEFAQREALWRRAFPPAAPRDGFDPGDFAPLNLAGGAIRNIALNAAFIAAEDGGVILRRHVAAALRTEYRKLERPLAELDVGGFA